MRILIRTDASLQIGTGHVMRCLTLAVKLRELGDDIIFSCRSHPGNLIEYICKRFEFRTYPIQTSEQIDSFEDPPFPAHEAWLGSSWKADADAVSNILESLNVSGNPVDGIIVDHYGLDSRWERSIQTKVNWLMAIDDLADRPHACDILLDQNLYEDTETRYLGLVDSGCTKLLGSSYALLRHEFSETRALLNRTYGKLQRILVFFGGIDLGNSTAKALNALCTEKWKDVTVDVVVGETNPHSEQIRFICESRPNFNFRQSVKDMAKLMAQSDLAIGAGGTTSWERCCLGLPSLTVCLAENQAELLQALNKTGAIMNLGSSESLTVDSLSSTLDYLSGNLDLLKKMSQISLTLVDGKGADRVAASMQAFRNPVIISTTLKEATVPLLRKARPSDLLTYFGWANEMETRKNSFDSATIELSTHQRWFRSKLIDPNAYLYILELNGKPVGQIRFLCDLDSATIGFSVDRKFRGQGFGQLLIEKGSKFLIMDRPSITLIRGLVKKTNTASIKSFINAGYTLDSEILEAGVESQIFIYRLDRKA